MIVEKRSFTQPEFRFGISGRTLPVTVGYETYGQLNAARDNAVLLCHYFTGTSHAAGRYAPDDPAPGWWDALIGPGRPIDTDRFFVICSDVIGNINANNPRVITTGPTTIDPTTGRPYGCRFPIFTLDDMVRLQRDLVISLGISRLVAIGGASMGGLQAFTWARRFPGFADRIFAVAATPMIRPYGIMVPNQLGIDAIRLDPAWRGGDYYGHEPPNQGLLLAFKILLMATRTDPWAEALCGRQPADPTGEKWPAPHRGFDGRFKIETEIEATVLARMQFFDANSYLYIAKANALFDLCDPGQDLAAALRTIATRTLMIIDASDLLFTPAHAAEAMKYLPNADTFTYDSGNGHLSALFDTQHFAERLREFLR